MGNHSKQFCVKLSWCRVKKIGADLHFSGSILIGGKPMDKIPK
jgi:hypothetical protein